MGRIKCPACNKSNRAKRKTCCNCHEPIAHLRGEKSLVRMKSQQVWPKIGTKVRVIRSDHGWYDGNVGGTYIGNGIVLGDDGYEYNINEPRDITEDR